MRAFPAFGASVLSIILLLAPLARAEGCCKEFAPTISPIQQATQADVVIIGKITDLEPDLTMIEQYKGGGPIAHMIANVRIEDSLAGVQGLTNLRIGFVPTNRPFQSEEFGIQLQRNGRQWRGNVNLVQGQEACFMLQRHPIADFYVLLPYAYPIDKNELTFDADMKAVRNVLKAFREPVKALQAKDASERQLAACALVTRYRTQRNSNVPVTVTNVPIAADESKLILQALSEMKWGELPFDPNGTFSVQNVFHQLGLTPQNGWQQPQPKANEDHNAVMDKAVSDWFKANAETFRIQRLVMKPASAQ